MPAPLVPMMPKEGTFDLRPDEMMGVNWYVLSGCAKQDAFLKFIRPDFLGSKSEAAIRGAVMQFFSSKKVKDYIDAYSRTISALSEPKPEEKEKKGSTEERKAKAKTKLLEFAMDLANNIDNASDPEFVLKIADKAGLLGVDEVVEEKPRRYLPVTCDECAYRKFVEENCERTDDDGIKIEGE